MIEKNKNALSDEMITKLNYTIEHLIEHGQKYEFKNVTNYILIKDGKCLLYTIDGDNINLCANFKEFSPFMVYTIKGENKFREDPEGVLEVAEDLGVFRFYE